MAQTSLATVIKEVTARDPVLATSSLWRARSAAGHATPTGTSARSPARSSSSNWPVPPRRPLINLTSGARRVDDVGCLPQRAGYSLP